MASILIVDDNADNRCFLSTLLGYRGHHTCEAANGSDALAAAQTERPGLIVSDLVMPTMDGFELLRRLRAEAAIAHTPVVFYSAAYAWHEVQVLLEHAGIVRFLTKPADPEEILRTIDEALEAAGTEMVPLEEEFDRQHLRLLTDKLARQLAALEWQVAERERTEKSLRESQMQVQTLQKESRDPVFAGENDRRYWRASATAETFLGSPLDLAAGQPCADFLLTERAAWLAARDREALDHGGSAQRADDTNGDDGRSPKLPAVKFSFVKAEAGNYTLGGIAADIAQRKLAADELQCEEARLRAIVDDAAEGIITTDRQGLVVSINSAAADIFGYPADEVLGRNVNLLMACVASEERRASGPRARSVTDREILGRRKQGSLFPLDVVVTEMLIGGRRMFTSIVRDISERKRTEAMLARRAAELADLASTDRLTGLRNACHFHDALAETLSLAADSGWPLSVVLLDVDGFKPYNDALGEPAGDEVLRRVGTILRRFTRASDLAARYCGGEFALLLPATDHTGAGAFAERVRTAIAKVPWSLRPVTVSFGLATTRTGAGDGETLLAEAGAALYRAKSAGRDRVVHHDDPVAPAGERVVI